MQSSHIAFEHQQETLATGGVLGKFITGERCIQKFAVARDGVRSGGIEIVEVYRPLRELPLRLRSLQDDEQTSMPRIAADRGIERGHRIFLTLQHLHEN